MDSVWNVILLAANVIALGLFLWRGQWPERIGAGLIAAAVVAEHFAQGLVVGTWRLGLLLVNLGLFSGLVYLSERWDRWWTVLAGAFQLVLVLTFLMPVMTSEFSNHTGVAIRLCLWAVISLILLAGAWEAQAARRFALEGASNGHSVPKSRRRLG